MSEGGSGGAGEIPEVTVEGRRGISVIWIIPIVALAVGGWVAWRAIQERGPQIVVHFETAQWLEAGKTRIKLLDVDVGTVDEIHIGKDLSGVELHCTLVPEAVPYLTEDAAFWIVHPRIGGGQISGLGTLVSGAYVSFAPGSKGKKRLREFTGLEVPPVSEDESGGTRVDLHSTSLGSLGYGSPIYFREIKVGSIEGHSLDDDGGGVVLHGYIEPEHAKLLRKDSRFWNVGGIELDVGAGKLDVKTASLASLLSGGVAFDAPGGEASPAAENGARYWLHPSQHDLESYPYRYGGLRIIAEGSALGGLEVGSGVYYREIQVGAVVSQQLATDSRHVRLELNIEPRYESLVRSNSVFWNASGLSAKLGLSGVEIHTESLQSILAGGVAFATPDQPGSRVKAGSVFRLHPEVKDDWLAWEPLLWRGAAKDAPKEAAKQEPEEHGIARFFHHEDKDEETAAKDSEPVKVSVEEKKHGFFHHLFHGGD